MGFIKEFKQFAVKGNVIDMAVGVIIGAAFGKIISSLVENIIMPPLSYMLSGVDFTELEYVLAEPELGPDGAVLTEKVAIEYGQFLQASLNFILVALVIFLFIKGINRMKKKAEDPKNKEVETPKDIALLAEIRDLLKEKS